MVQFIRNGVTHFLVKFITECSPAVFGSIKTVATVLPGFNHLNSRRLTVSNERAAVSPMWNAPLFTTRHHRNSLMETCTAILLLQHMLRACTRFLCSICQDRKGIHWHKELTTVRLSCFCLPISVNVIQTTSPAVSQYTWTKKLDYLHTSINSLFFHIDLNPTFFFVIFIKIS